MGAYVNAFCENVNTYLNEEAQTFPGEQGCEILDFVNGDMIVYPIIGWREVNLDESELGSGIHLVPVIADHDGSSKEKCWTHGATIKYPDGRIEMRHYYYDHYVGPWQSFDDFVNDHENGLQPHLERSIPAKADVNSWGI
jgi:hypothetical protein